jgi:arsenate reductase (thioredoxin)
MAEGFAKELGEGLIEAHSAGLAPQGVNPRAVTVMKEIGIDISKQTSKSINEQLLKKMDIVITLCDNAAESCPLTPPGIRRIHWPLEDPAKAAGSEEEIMSEFRKVRDEIEKRVKEFINEIKRV